mmetsp:Transcript_13554/g.24467  ORF Transcript_13554/g.24467 Transcript_13554/m.24467 type:complete len:228 (+) Transcript_13554:161-844(+)
MRTQASATFAHALALPSPYRLSVLPTISSAHGRLRLTRSKQFCVHCFAACSSRGSTSKTTSEPRFCPLLFICNKPRSHSLSSISSSISFMSRKRAPPRLISSRLMMRRRNLPAATGAALTESVSDQHAPPSISTSRAVSVVAAVDARLALVLETFSAGAPHSPQASSESALSSLSSLPAVIVFESFSTPLTSSRLTSYSFPSTETDTLSLPCAFTTQPSYHWPWYCT